ncbi:MAG TPA: hydroxyacid dehydrogenase [Actinospica sp.]|nr:hydroxyacid dehydrogenase [Actinospica sp.]
MTTSQDTYVNHPGARAASTRRPRTLLAMSPTVADKALGGYGLARLAEVADLVPGLVADDFDEPRAAAALAGAEVLVTHWGCPVLDAAVLARAPQLRAIVHVAGTVKGFVTDACWERGIAVSSAAWANALPVAEYTVAAIIFANKRILHMREDFRQGRGRRLDLLERYPNAGNYRRTIGVVGASSIGRRVLELLQPFDFELLVYDPFLSGEHAEQLGARLVELDELCAESDVVSLHAPQIPETLHMLDERRLWLIRDGATVINTARGSLVDGPALAAQLERGRLYAVIDVTEPEVLPADSVLYDLPNVLLTPHVAGSVGNELGRLVDAAADELARYAAGLDFAHPVLRRELERSA